MHNFTDRAPLDILSSNPSATQRVPAVMDLHLLPDMGRMTAESPWAENRGYSRDPTAEHSAVRRYIT